MPSPNSLQYATQAADMILRIGRANSMREFNRGAGQREALQRIPGNVQGMMGQRDQRAVQAQQAEMRELQLKQGRRQEQESMQDFADDAVMDDILERFTKDGETDFLAVSQAASDAGLHGRAEAYQGKARQADDRSFLEGERAYAADQRVIAANERQRAEKQRRAESVAKALGDAKNDSTWAAGIRQLERDGIDTKGMPHRYDPAFQNSAITAAQSFAGWAASRKPEPDDKVPAPTTRLVDGQRRGVVWKGDGRWYLIGDMQTPIDPSRVQPLPAGGDGDSKAFRRQILQWGTAGLNTLDANRRRSRGVDADGIPIPPMTDGEYNTSRGRFFTTIQGLLGADTPDEWLTPEPRQTPSVPAGRGSSGRGRRARAAGVTPSGAALQPGTTQIVTQGGVRYRVTTDAQGIVISADPVQ